jgi:hypothetical protein
MNGVWVRVLTKLVKATRTTSTLAVEELLGGEAGDLFDLGEMHRVADGRNRRRGRGGAGRKGHAALAPDGNKRVSPEVSRSTLRSRLVLRPPHRPLSVVTTITSSRLPSRVASSGWVLSPAWSLRLASRPLRWSA